MFIGSSRYNSDGTVTKGSAEGGRKIIIYEVNQFDRTNATRLKRYMKTIHHEFTHIANQTIEFPKEYELISPWLRGTVEEHEGSRSLRCRVYFSSTR